MELIEKAKNIAEKAHEGQVRKTDGTPYIVHPFAVADILKKYDFGDTVIAAALVHDVLEDTDVTEEYLRQELGDEVANIVVAVSEDKSLPWKERKKRYIETVSNAGDSVKAVSIADKIHNAKSVLLSHAVMGEEVWNKFNRGKEEKLWFENAMLEMLKARWKHPLMTEYETLVSQLNALV